MFHEYSILCVLENLGPKENVGRPNSTTCEHEETNSIKILSTIEEHPTRSGDERYIRQYYGCGYKRLPTAIKQMYNESKQ